MIAIVIINFLSIYLTKVFIVNIFLRVMLNLLFAYIYNIM